jgi:hypothetical protein
MSTIEMRELLVLEPDFAVFVCLEENGLAGPQKS